MKNSSQTHGKLVEQFQNWLDQDPDNSQLIADAIGAAIDVGALEQAETWISTYTNENDLSPELLNLKGVLAIRQGNFGSAIASFGRLVENDHDTGSVRFNLAYCHAMADEREKAIELIDDEMVVELPQAAALRVQMMHGDGRFEEAMEAGTQLLAIHPQDSGLLAAMSVLAMDLEDKELAHKCASKAGEHPDAFVTLGMLELDTKQTDAAMLSFGKALQANSGNARAWIGQGLARLSSGDGPGAIHDLDQGAELFGSHIGSWIASGWAYFLNDDLESCRRRFETALALDPSFAESQGSIAVLDAMDGNFEAAEERCEKALRLDRQSFSAALAKSLILQSKGDDKKAEKIVQIALNTPIDGDGTTLASRIVGMGFGRKP